MGKCSEYRLVEVTTTLTNPQVDRRIKREWAYLPEVKAGTRMLVLTHYEPMPWAEGVRDRTKAPMMLPQVEVLPVQAEFSHHAVAAANDLGKLVLANVREIPEAEWGYEDVVGLIRHTHAMRESTLLEELCAENPLVLRGLLALAQRVDRRDDVALEAIRDHHAKCKVSPGCVPLPMGVGEPRIAEVSVDEAEYVGDSHDGVYVQAAEYTGDEREHGWYVSGLVDSDTGSFVDVLFADDGPYPDQASAMEAGRSAAIEWCYANDVDYRINEVEP
jgi:hypothetical protein